MEYYLLRFDCGRYLDKNLNGNNIMHAYQFINIDSAKRVQLLLKNEFNLSLITKNTENGFKTRTRKGIQKNSRNQNYR